MLMGTVGVGANEYFKDQEAGESARQRISENAARPLGHTAVTPSPTQPSPEARPSPASPPPPETPPAPEPEAAPPPVPTPELPEPAADSGVPQPGKSLGDFKSTCYALRGKTATGAEVGPGTVAVDPDVIPLGSELYIENYGRATAKDTGSAINGEIVDVWYPSVSRCRQWGVKTVQVTMIEE